MVFFVVVNQLLQHAVQNRRNCEEPLNSGTNVVQSLLITEYLLDDEGGNCLGKCLSILHDPQTQWYDFGMHEEGNGIWVAFFDKCANDA